MFRSPLGDPKEKRKKKVKCFREAIAMLRPGRCRMNSSGPPSRSLTWTEALNDVSDVDHPVILFVSLTDLLEQSRTEQTG